MDEWYKRAREDILDSMDEELEMELDDGRLSPDGGSGSAMPRNVYFKELFRLQGELVKLQDWVVENKLKVAVLLKVAILRVRVARSNGLHNVLIPAFVKSLH